jgi:hypothetical protein
MHRPIEGHLSQVFAEAPEKQFLHSGFVKLEEAFPKAEAEEASIGAARAKSTIETPSNSKSQPQMKGIEADETETSNTGFPCRALVMSKTLCVNRSSSAVGFLLVGSRAAMPRCFRLP